MIHYNHKIGIKCPLSGLYFLAINNNLLIYSVCYVDYLHNGIYIACGHGTSNIFPLDKSFFSWYKCWLMVKLSLYKNKGLKVDFSRKSCFTSEWKSPSFTVPHLFFCGVSFRVQGNLNSSPFYFKAQNYFLWSQKLSHYIFEIDMWPAGFLNCKSLIFEMSLNNVVPAALYVLYRRHKIFVARYQNGCIVNII